MDLYTPLADLAAELTTADVLPAVLDVADLNPPAILVTLARVDSFTMNGGGRLHVALYLTVGDQSEARALEAISDHLPGVRAALVRLGLPTTGAIEPALVPPSDGGRHLPAVKIPTQLTLKGAP